MIEIPVTQNMDKKAMADSIHTMIKEGLELLTKPRLDASDNGKIKLLRTLNGTINAGVAMIQQETAMIRAAVVVERMKQLGFGNGAEQIEAPPARRK